MWAARKLKRAVRWTAERSESFLSDAQGRDNYSVAELALDGEHRFLALRVTTWANMGAYLSNFGPFIPQLAAPMLSGVYKVPCIYLNVKGTLTNTVPVDAYRGAGRPEAIYLLERTIDFERIAHLQEPKVFVSATHVATGKAEIFSGKRLTAASVMASACLPMLFRAVEIDGEAYWDGGYSGNPAIHPLIYRCQSTTFCWCKSTRWRATNRPTPPTKFWTVSTS